MFEVYLLRERERGASTLIHPLETKLAVLGWLKGIVPHSVQSFLTKNYQNSSAADMERDWKRVNIFDNSQDPAIKIKVKIEINFHLLRTFKSTCTSFR